MNNRTKISIIMPVYNCCQYLSLAIKSVLNQSYKNFELILVDDGSTDGSGTICDNFSKLDKRIKVIHQRNNGICHSRNVGLKNAEGTYVTFIDDDDEIESNTLKDNLYIAEKYNLDWIKYGKTEIISENNIILNEKQTSFSERLYKSNYEVLKNLLSLRFTSLMTFVWDSFFRKQIIDDNTIQFDEKFKRGYEDIDFCEQYAFYARNLYVNSNSYYKHYTRIGISTSSKYSPESIDLALYMLNKSNKRYDWIRQKNIDDYKKSDFYYLNVTRQFLIPICRQLNIASTTKNKKISILEKVSNDSSFDVYNSSKKVYLAHRNIKLEIYKNLFIRKYFATLLFFDRTSRRLLYWMRELKHRI